MGGASSPSGGSGGVSGAGTVGTGHAGAGDTSVATGGDMGLGGTAIAMGGVSALGGGGASAGGNPEAGGTAIGGTSGGGASASVSFATARLVVTGVRGTATPAAQSVIELHNGSQVAVQVAALALSGANGTAFKVTSPAAFPAALAAGADLSVTVEMMTSGAAVPADMAMPKVTGSVLMTATLTATLASGNATANVYGLVLSVVNFEPTLGQILTTLGYKLNVGKAQNDWNPNTSMNAVDLPGVEAGTDEVPASHFVKAGVGNVTMNIVARFSPVGALPYGYYMTTTGCPAGCTTVGTMAQITDAQTSDKARMVFPPLVAGSMTSFDPGAGPFGLWVYSDQKTQKFKEGGTVANGDWDYSQDALNVPIGNPPVHRFKSYPLKDAAGTPIPHTYLVATEEAGNGDYQDYVWVLGNVTAMP
jgi:hypothetical protein